MTAVFALIFTSTLLLAASSPPEKSPSHSSCTDELVAFSPCLAYVSAEPNNMTDEVPSPCCHAISKALEFSGGNCFCYIVRQPLIFGFPLNVSRVVSLTSVCSSGNGSLAAMNGGSVDSICSGSQALPPLQSTTGSMISNSGQNDIQSPCTNSPAENVEMLPPSSNLTPGSAVSSPKEPKSLLKPTSRSSPMRPVSNSSSWFLPVALVIFFSFIFLNGPLFYLLICNVAHST